MFIKNIEILNLFRNFDLLSVGITTAAIGILGFIIFFNNRKSITNQTFLLLSLAVVFWSIANFFSYQFSSPFWALWLLRLVIFFAVWFAFFIFQLFYVFPKEDVIFSKKYKFILLPFAFITSIITLTPLVFMKATEFSLDGSVSKVVNGPGIFLFGAAVIFLNIGGIYLLIRKTIKASGTERKQFRSILTGTFITLFLLVVFNFIFPAFFDNARFIPMGAVFIFPLIAFTSYAILRHRFMNIKIVATGITTFLLAIATFTEVILSQGISVLIFRSLVFLLVLIFGILLIKSVQKEVEQREKLEVLTKELQAANERLKELDKMKSEFLSFASHQIKSPMAIIKGFATLISDGSYGPVSDKVKEVVVRITESVDRLIGLVNNFLDLRRIEEGRMEYKFEVIDVVKFTKRIADDFKILAKDKNLDLSFEAPEKEINASIDAQKLSQVIQNLIDNSIKYTEKGWVKASVSELNDKEILIVVSDSGRGISKELSKKLFEQFSRDSAIDKSKRGTGLGLFIARQIVLAHKGEIWAESEGKGKGSRFLVKLPKVL